MYNKILKQTAVNLIGGTPQISTTVLYNYKLYKVYSVNDNGEVTTLKRVGSNQVIVVHNPVLYVVNKKTINIASVYEDAMDDFILKYLNTGIINFEKITLLANISWDNAMQEGNRENRKKIINSFLRFLNSVDKKVTDISNFKIGGIHPFKV